MASVMPASPAKLPSNNGKRGGLEDEASIDTSIDNATVSGGSVTTGDGSSVTLSTAKAKKKKGKKKKIKKEKFADDGSAADEVRVR
jgi:hypothetical protein